MKKLLTALSLALLATTAVAQECSIDLPRSASNTRFAVNNNGTVKDLQTGLTWMRCPLGMSFADGQCTGAAEPLTWQAALTQAQAINNVDGEHALHNFGGMTEWRLPNIKELVNLTEQACHSPALNDRAFGSAYSLIDELPYEATSLWSSTSNADGSVWSFDVFNGETYFRSLSDTYSVLLVADK